MNEWRFFVALVQLDDGHGGPALLPSRLAK